MLPERKKKPQNNQHDLFFSTSVTKKGVKKNKYRGKMYVVR